ncbi:MAG: nucleotidyltransferase domain-containing protein [Lachnospiraceae bacterium]|nr:nucleotidyltransferase domain-containing protein [Lachnospiraceae bacterium]
MPQLMQELIQEYTTKVCNIYGSHIRQIILYGSYARGDYREDSDVDIMILLDLSDMDIKDYRHQLSDMTFDFNMDNDVDFKPIAKNEEHFNKWVLNYPFYSNISKDGVKIYAAT